MVSGTYVFHRPALAQSIVSGLAGDGLIDYSGGLFLAAPRRTGKSTFLRQDLMPACEQYGWEVVYVDLWADRQMDPGLLIERAIVARLQTYAPRIKKLLSAAGVDSVTLHKTLTWDLTGPALPDEATLTEALQVLHEASERLVVLFIDEAQHALSSEQGMNTMFALKAARDALILGRAGPGLRLVFTGSSRDKLAQLVLSRDQPFFGNTVTPFPLLGDDFVEAFTDHVNARLAPGNTFQAADVARTFERVGRRPELLWDVIKRVALEHGRADDLGKLLEHGAQSIQADYQALFQFDFDLLPELQRAILLALARTSAQQRPFTPFTKDTLKEIQVIAKRKTQPSASTIQRALDSLREKGLVWRSGRGVYAIEDSGMGDWLLYTDKAGPADNP